MGPDPKYQLHCEEGHEFEGWFSDSADYDEQNAKQMVSCPVCDSFKIAKSIMAPNVTRTGSSSSPEESTRMEAYRDYISRNFEYAGNDFVDRVRTTDDAVCGYATKTEIEELREEGHNISTIPPMKSELN